MRILALDMGNTTGWSHSKHTGGIWRVKRRGEKLGERQRRERLRQMLTHVWEDHRLGIDIIHYEKTYHHRKGTQITSQGRLEQYVRGWAQDHKIPHVGHTAHSIKRFATGNGQASKATMLALAHQTWPELIINSDHADARWLLAMIQSQTRQ